MWLVLWLAGLFLVAVVGCRKQKTYKRKTPDNSSQKTKSKMSVIKSRETTKEKKKETPVVKEKTEEKTAIELDRTQTWQSTRSQKSTATAIDRDDDTRDGIESLQMVEPDVKSDSGREKPAPMKSAREPTVVLNLKENVTVQYDPSIFELKNMTGRDMPTAQEIKGHESPKKNKNRGEPAKKK